MAPGTYPTRGASGYGASAAGGVRAGATSGQDVAAGVPPQRGGLPAALVLWPTGDLRVTVLHLYLRQVSLKGLPAIAGDWRGPHAGKIQADVHHVRLTEQASIDNRVFNQAMATSQSQFHLDLDAAHASFESMVASQAAVMGLDDFLYASTFIFILITPLIWLTRPTKSGDSTEASAAH